MDDKIYTAGYQKEHTPRSVELTDTSPVPVSDDDLETEGRKLAKWLYNNTSKQFMNGLIRGMDYYNNLSSKSAW